MILRKAVAPVMARRIRSTKGCEEYEQQEPEFQDWEAHKKD